jgi:hypothetical protein
MVSYAELGIADQVIDLFDCIAKDELDLLQVG